MTIKWRLIYILSFLVVFLLGVEILGLFGMSNAIGGLKTVYHDRAIPLKQMADIESLLLQNRLAITSALLAPTPEAIQNKTAAVERDIEEMTRIWQDYLKTYLTPEEESLAAKFSEDRDEFITEGIQAAVKALRANETEDAYRILMEKIHPLYQSVDTSIKALFKLQVDEVKREYDGQQDRYETILDILVISVVVALALAVLISIMLRDSVFQPLEKVVKISRDIAAGNFLQKIEVQSKDEVGQLMQALKEMRDSLVDTIDQVRDSEAHTRALLSNLIDGVASIDEQGLIKSFNPAAEHIFGYLEREVIGQNINLLLARQGSGGQNADHLSNYLATIKSPALGRTHEVTGIRKNGTSFPMDLAIVEIHGGNHRMYVAIFRDITEQMLAQESMRLAAMVYENTTEAIMVADTNDNIISINPAFTRVTGYTPDDIMGKNINVLNTGLHNAAFFEAIQTSLRTTGYWEGEMTGRRKDMQTFVEWRKVNAIYDKDGRITRWVALFSDITKRKEADVLIWQQANFDTLTGLPNRHMFRNRLEQEIRKTNRSGSSIALILLDLDCFKEVNDIYGHKIGDLLLKDAAQRLNRCVREIDTVARLGGDEFILILGGVNNPISINRVVRDILRKMADPFQLGDEVAYVSASIGITFYPQDADDMEVLLSNADQAMYAAKNQGRNCFSYFTRALQEAAQTRMRLASDLRGALAGGQFQLYYQPIVNLASGYIHKAEALVRWHHPKLGLVNPAVFISIAEETRMIVDIGDWVFRTAMQQTKNWRTLHCAEFQMSVNTSPVQFRKDVDLHKIWSEFLQELELPGQSVAIEITEGLLMDASTAVTLQLLAFKNAGIQVSMDDFGTGYSSLGYLKRFDIDYLKIDQSFVRSLAPDSNDLALCEAIIVMAHKLDLKVIAEGVETADQRDLLTLAGCDYGQGNLFSKPVPADEFEKLHWPT
ncbi:EAL domain-containing protein [Nitrosospira sp. NpAV]|uniref:EAL domain-containing protein n=1 Tax=Nitrosospira sp. NpAV TaxID=58133 RepID=UPI000698BF93|nr:EAL domain-containing protein [Nitrosospira sp. NpAV]